jgi:hypothetical protein
MTNNDETPYQYHLLNSLLTVAQSGDIGLIDLEDTLLFLCIIQHDATGRQAFIPVPTLLPGETEISIQENFAAN